MVYESFEKLWKEYPNGRETETLDELITLVDDLFDTYEATGFADTFDSPFSDKTEYIGKPFKVVGRLSYVNDEVDLEVLPMWHIQFDNGDIIDAYPEEISKVDREAI